MSITLELDEAVVFVALKHNLTFNEYKLMAEWLDCYNYVLPLERGLSDKFIHCLCYYPPRTPTDIYKTWMKSNIVYTTLTIAKQVKILSWLANLNCRKILLPQ